MGAVYQHRNWLHFACVLRLWEAEFKGNRVMNLVEEISKQPSIQAVAWLLLDAFSQVYSENQEQRTEQKFLKNLQFGQKSQCKVGAKEEINVI
jgi:hypothetical protein